MNWTVDKEKSALLKVTGCPSMFVRRGSAILVAPFADVCVYVCMYYTEFPRKVHVTVSWNEEEGNYKQSEGRKGYVEQTMSLNHQEQQ